MQNFQQILTQAAQLKQHQLKKDRKGYEALPQFLKAGLGYNKKYGLIRKQNFHYQLRISNRVKQAGNASFKEEKYQQALNRYEEALSIFRYIESKSYENMKDQDLQYLNYDATGLRPQLRQKYENHLCALYLNICSCLTRLNKKQDAIYSADQALKIKKTAKGHYRKAQAYLKYVNRDVQDIKLGLLELKQAWTIDNDPSILRQMHEAKENFEKEQEKSKNWFKFMFDKNKKQGANANINQNQIQLKPKDQKPIQKHQQDPQKQKAVKQMKQLQKASAGMPEDEKVKFERIKQKLLTYISLQQSKWLYFYQKDFIKRHGSKIYSTLKIYKYDDLAAEFRNVLAKCLQKEQSYEKMKKSLQECIEWLRMHPVDKIAKYTQRYDLQTNWIKENRNKDNSQFQIKSMKEQANQENKEDTSKKEEIKKVEQFMDSFQSKQNQFLQQQKVKQYKNSFKEARTQKKQEQRINQNQIPAQERQNIVQDFKQNRKKYITIGIILILLLIRFIFST